MCVRSCISGHKCRLDVAVSDMKCAMERNHGDAVQNTVYTTVGGALAEYGRYGGVIGRRGMRAPVVQSEALQVAEEVCAWNRQLG